MTLKRGATVDEKLAHYLERQGDCLVWTGRLVRGGYGIIKLQDGKTSKPIHKFVWEQEHGEVPFGLVVDHLCHNRACCELTHLRVATNKQNAENRKGATRNAAVAIRGVSIHRKTGKFIAQVQHNNKRMYLGLYVTAEEAGEVARLKRLELFTHNDIDRRAA